MQLQIALAGAGENQRRDERSRKRYKRSLPPRRPESCVAGLTDLIAKGEAVQFIEINQDAATGLTLVGDQSVPTRYYLLEERRRHLLAIGEREIALRRFALWVEQIKNSRGNSALH